MTELPFSHQQFLDVFGAYNRALWPAAVLIWLLTALAIGFLFRQGHGAARIVSVVLAFHWAWSGLVYHLTFFRTVNPAAVIFGIVFVMQSVLLLWRGVLTGRLSFCPTSSMWRRVGWGLIVYALVYPAVGLALGLTYPLLPSFGVPCPTGILTIGLLLLAPKREGRILGAIPMLWSVVGGSAAVLLDIRADFVLLISGLFLLANTLALPPLRGKPWREPHRGKT